MVSKEELESELSRLRLNADNLADCLGSLLKRIEELEMEAVSAKQTPFFSGIESATMRKVLMDANPDGSETSTKREFITVDPMTGRKKRTTVTEHVIRATKYYSHNNTDRNSCSAQSPTGHANASVQEVHENNYLAGGGDRLLASAYEARIVQITADLLSRVEVEFMCGEAVVMKVGQEVAKLIHPGDTILEVNGIPVHSKKQLYSIVQWEGDSASTPATLKLVLSDIYTAPMEFCKVLEDHTSNEITLSELESQERSKTGALPYLSFNLKKGDVLQVLSTDKTYMQARKVNDLSKAGFVPSNIKVERVAMLSPYGRRVLVLLGAAGVGRRTLKTMLLEQLPNHFSTVVPLTSRAAKPTEQEGREYHFQTKEYVLQKIRHGQMIEWGEHNEQLYGTSADSVRRVIRSGRVCVLDCAPKALKYLYNREFMPYVVVLAAPQHEELLQMTELRAKLDPADAHVDYKKLKEVCEQSERLLVSDYAKHFHLVLVNRNRDVTLRRLLDALEHLKNESQWIPVDWLS